MVSDDFAEEQDRRKSASSSWTSTQHGKLDTWGRALDKSR